MKSSPQDTSSPSIEVTNLQKTFQTKRKAAGMRGSLRALVKPKYNTVEAVRGLGGEELTLILPRASVSDAVTRMCGPESRTLVKP